MHARQHYITNMGRCYHAFSMTAAAAAAAAWKGLRHGGNTSGDAFKRPLAIRSWKSFTLGVVKLAPFVIRQTRLGLFTPKGYTFCCESHLQCVTLAVNRHHKTERWGCSLSSRSYLRESEHSSVTAVRSRAEPGLEVGDQVADQSVGCLGKSSEIHVVHRGAKGLGTSELLIKADHRVPHADADLLT